jgi:fructokinase
MNGPPVREYVKVLTIIILTPALEWSKTMQNKQSLYIFGEVLFDHFPDGSRVLGGAPFNVAWHLQAFGQTPIFISRIGDDPPGRAITASMESWGMCLDALQTDCNHPTGKVQVLVNDGEPHYEIVVDCAYDFIDQKMPLTEPTQGILYHGSLALRNPITRTALQTLMTQHQGKHFIDINLRPPWWTLETLLPFLYDADYVKLNETELMALCPEYSGFEIAMLTFYKQFDLELLVVTRGAKGAIAYDKQVGYAVIPPPASTVVVDTVGAGDAFAAILILGLKRQWPLEMTLQRAQEFASAMVGLRGATVADSAFYRKLRDRWG